MPLKALAAGWVFGNDAPALGLFGDAPDMVYTSSGSAALLIALLACKATSQRRKVIIPAYTCPSVLAAVERAGLQAVLCDLASGQLHMDEARLADLLGEDTLAVVYVHLFGLDRRPVAIRALTQKTGAWFIEDAAQALGNRADGKYLGGDGDLAVLSFGRGKPLSALHGGAVRVNDPDLAAPVHRAMQENAAPLPAWFGIYYRLLLAAYAVLFHPRLFALPRALPWFRIGETVYLEKIPVHHMARPGRRVLRELLTAREGIQHTRSSVARQYLAHLAPHSHAFAFIPREDDIATGPLRFPVVFKSARHKAEILRVLTELGLGASGSYPTPLDKQPGVPAYVVAQGPFLNAKAMAAGVLTLPTHEYVQKRDIEVMTSVIGGAVSGDSLT
jgi:dTDP-4-amino-4,6-dideoxygalactose transaminase